MLPSAQTTAVLVAAASRERARSGGPETVLGDAEILLWPQLGNCSGAAWPGRAGNDSRYRQIPKTRAVIKKLPNCFLVISLSHFLNSS
jgi:hypothetical protein